MVGRRITLAPSGLAIENIEAETDTLRIVATPVSTTALWPVCGIVSARIHSRYQRTLTDLPWRGRRVALSVGVRRTGKSCGRGRQVVRGGGTDIFSSRMSSLDPFLTQLEAA